MKPVDEERLDDVKANIHPEAWWAIDDWESFRWHRNRLGQIDTHVPHSSQAFAISVWGTFANPTCKLARRTFLGVPGFELASAFSEVPNLKLEFEDRDLLNEWGGVATNIDAVLMSQGMTVVIESKLTEEFGRCSQAKGGHCTGRYQAGSDLKTKTSAACRLTVPERNRTARRYFEVMRAISREGALDEGIHCPFSGRGYQVMRNIAFASQLGRARGTEWMAIFALPASRRPSSVREVDRIQGMLQQEHAGRVMILDYQALQQSLERCGKGEAGPLAEYMASRLELVSDE